MGRQIAQCKMCRREKEKLFLKGEKCFGAKCPVEKRKYPPGQHGAKVMRLTEYAKRLREKQKARRIYGLNERQFESYFDKADIMKGDTGQNLLILLERRLDNVVYKLGFAASRAAARQIVTHGHIKVNNRKVNIPSYQLRENEEIILSDKLLTLLREKLAEHTPPAWLVLEEESFKGRVVHLPTSDDTEKMIMVPLIVEYYSR
ncbi:MAG: 30S ribosomal protein S4 [Candidatus Saganbacteria bacterium]|nr:30S ribosomal protein S4 [Candidatus Saganbacteria bacterium]